MEARVSCEYSSVRSAMNRATEVGTRLIDVTVPGRSTEADRGAKSSGTARLLQRQRALIGAGQP